MGGQKTHRALLHLGKSIQDKDDVHRLTSCHAAHRNGHPEVYQMFVLHAVETMTMCKCVVCIRERKKWNSLRIMKQDGTEYARVERNA